MQVEIAQCRDIARPFFHEVDAVRGQHPTPPRSRPKLSRHEFLFSPLHGHAPDLRAIELRLRVIDGLAIWRLERREAPLPGDLQVLAPIRPYAPHLVPAAALRRVIN